MSDPLTTVRENLARVEERIHAAARDAGRSRDEVRLVGVTKYVNAATAALLAQAGCHDLGESRPQELWAKAEAAEFADLPVRWHAVGHLQRNKVNRTIPLVAIVHSVDSVRLLKAIDACAAGLGVVRDALLEVNCSGDPEKHGVAPEDLPAVIQRLPEFPRVHIRGLMTMAAREGGLEVARRNFARLRELRDQAAIGAPEGVELTELSMGMSADFEAAIAEGATIVRVGTALWEGLAD